LTLPEIICTLPPVLQDKAAGVQVSKTAIVGGGVIGLTTGIVFAEAGHDTTIYTRDKFENTTSFAAGAIGFPTDVEESPRVLDWFAATNAELATLSVDEGVTLVDWQKISAQPLKPSQIPFWLKTVNGREIGPDEVWYGSKKGMKAGIAAKLFHMNVDVYARYLHQRFEGAAGTEHHKIEEVTSLESMFKDHEVVVNCTGLDAAKLIPGENLIYPARGQVVIVENLGFKNHFATFMDDPVGKLYMYPRGDKCLIGGTFQPHNDNRSPDPVTTQAIIAKASALEEGVADADILDVRVGLRPVRLPHMRFEKIERPDGGILIHNVGHGGCGFTLAWGCAYAALEFAQR
jgi:D-amino-acid oxidase